MSDKYQQLGNLLKAYTQSTTEPAQVSPEEQDRQALGAYLSAVINNSPLTRAQIVQNADIPEVTLYGLERGLIPVAYIDQQALRRLANALGEDATTFGLLLGSRFPITNTLNNQTRLTMSTERPPIPMSEQQDSSSKHPKRWFMMPKVIVPSIALGGVAAAILVAVILNSGLVDRSTDFNYTSNNPSLSGSPLTIPASADDQLFMSSRGNNSSVALATSTGVAVAVAQVTATPAPAAQVIATLAPNMNTQKSIVTLNTTELSASEPSSVGNIGAAYGSGDPEADGALDLAWSAASTNQADQSDNFSSSEAEAFQIPTPTSAPLATSSPMPMISDDAAEGESDQSQSEEALESTEAELAAVSIALSPLPTPIPFPTPTVVPSLPSAMTFIDYGINAFTETATDNLSTFSVDVDTGSYTIARRYLNDGLLPPPEAIRVEEFVNYFDYGYEQPPQNEAFAIHVDTYPSPFIERRINANEAGDVQLMRIGIQGYDVPKVERPDVALTFVIDVSGSMRDGGRLTLVKRALTMLVEQLRPSDTIGIVAYSTNARVLIQPTKVRDANTILDAIFKLQPENSTNVAAGLNLGYDMAWRNFNEQAINRVILASDGVANVDATNPKDIWEQAAQYADRGITLNSIGVGMGNYNDVIMEQLADNGDGVYGYVDTIEEAERLFVDELTGTLVTIAKDAKVQVEFNPEAVVRYRLLGYENRDVADADFRNDAVDAGEIGAGHSVTALYEVELVPEASGALATVNLRWQDIDSSEVTEINQPAMVSESEVSFEDAPRNFQLAAVAAEFAESLRNSLYVDAQMRNQEISEELRWWATQVIDAMEGDEDAMELFDLISQSQILADQ